jgi:hypothetical protein
VPRLRRSKGWRFPRAGALCRIGQSIHVDFRRKTQRVGFFCGRHTGNSGRNQCAWSVGDARQSPRRCGGLRSLSRTAGDSVKALKMAPIMYRSFPLGGDARRRRALCRRRRGYRLGYAKPTNAISQHCKGALKWGYLMTPGGVQRFRVIRLALAPRITQRVPAAPDSLTEREPESPMIARPHADECKPLRVRSELGCHSVSLAHLSSRRQSLLTWQCPGHEP